jgi:NAD(P)-dependent dehydrogenase (short-subunit alcohol dehydrogenase family)
MTRTGDMPSQQGRRAIVTGTAGIGYETALALSGTGAEVVIAGRSATTGLAAATRIQSLVPGARIAYERLDLSDLDSVARFASAMERRYDHIDLLVNNAAVMAPPTRQTSVNGFEMQLATNFLGHYDRAAPAAAAARTPRACRDTLEHGSALGGDQLRGHQRRDGLQPDDGLRPVEARLPDVRFRVAAKE